MTRDIIRLAREAGWHDELLSVSFTEPLLERFAALVAAAERERMDLNSIHSCHAECDNPFCVRVREAVAHEREACAKVADLVAREIDDTNGTATYIAKAIRARGEQ
jgi:hypothetical protein